jgi:hypothetical protein
MPHDVPTTPRTSRRRLKPRHAETVGKSVAPMVGFLGRLQRRLEATGFTPGERLYAAAAQAYDAVFTLNVLLHYDSCEREPAEPAADWVI